MPQESHPDQVLRVAAVNCTLKPSPQLSHTQQLMDLATGIFRREGHNVDQIRLVDHHLAPGVQPDMREHGASRDDWPDLAERILRADILVVGTPIWLGEKSSVCQQLIERLYAHSSQTNERGQYRYYGKVGACVITGNEDGIKHCAMGILYALQHIGYSIAPQADCGWIGEVGPGPSYGDTEWKGKALREPMGSASDFTNRNTTFMVYNAMHLAGLLKQNGGYSAKGNSRRAWEQGERWAFEPLKVD